MNFGMANRPRSIYQYSSMAPRLSGQNCKFFKLLLSLNSHKRLWYKRNNTKYRSLTWKPRSHVRILIYRTWPITMTYYGHYFKILPIVQHKFCLFVLRNLVPSCTNKQNNPETTYLQYWFSMGPFFNLCLLESHLKKAAVLWCLNNLYSNVVGWHWKKYYTSANIGPEVYLVSYRLIKLSQKERLFRLYQMPQSGGFS